MVSLVCPQKTVLPENIFVSIGKKYLKICRKQLPQIPRKNYIIEPCAKNTAPAIGLTALSMFIRDPKAIVATIASDHEMTKENNFVKDLKLAFKIAFEHPQFLITMGLKPTYPETGYGYIKVGQKFWEKGKQKIFRVEKFTEKPDKETAQIYFESLKYLWNASYFIFNSRQMLKYYNAISPRIARLLDEIKKSENQNDIDQIFEKMPAEPFDTEIVEKMDKVLVIPSDSGWSDVGSWKSVYDILSKKLGTSNICQGHHIGHNDENVFVLGHKKMIATVGLKDIAIIDTPDATLIINQNASQEVKKIIEMLKDRGITKFF